MDKGKIDMESRHRINWATVLVYVVLMALGFAAGIALLCITGQIQFGKDAPAWVQAIGSVVAILIAVAVPATQHFLAAKKQQQESLDRARSLGLMLLPAIRELSERINRMWSHEDPDGGVVDIREDACIAGHWTLEALDMPTVLTGHSHELHLLGQAANGVQRAVFNVQYAGDLVAEVELSEEASNGITVYKTEKVIYEKTNFYELMWDALRALTDSQNRIEAMFRKAPNAPASNA